MADGAGTTVTAVSARTLRRGKSIDVGGAPIDIAIAPHGRLAVVVTAFYDRPGLALVDLRRHAAVRRVHVGREPHAVAIAPGAKRAYVTGGGAKGTLRTVDLKTGRVVGKVRVGRHPRGLDISPDGKRALVALNGAGGVAVVDLERRKVARVIHTPAFPDRVAFAPDGRRALITHTGLKTSRVTLLDVKPGKVRRHLRAGRDPYDVAFSRDGGTAIVSDYGGAAITLVKLGTGRRRTVVVGPRPMGLAVGRKRAYVVSEFEGSVSSVRLARTRRARGGRRA